MSGALASRLPSRISFRVVSCVFNNAIDISKQASIADRGVDAGYRLDNLTMIAEILHSLDDVSSSLTSNKRYRLNNSRT
jgi:hypothetical protein